MHLGSSGSDKHFERNWVCTGKWYSIKKFILVKYLMFKSIQVLFIPTLTNHNFSQKSDSPSLFGIYDLALLWRKLEKDYGPNLRVFSENIRAEGSRM